MEDRVNEEFKREQERALERMREMKARSLNNSQPHKMPPAPPFVQLSREKTAPQENEYYEEPLKNEVREVGTAPQRDAFSSLLSDLKLPFLDRIKTDSDMLLVLGLLLILWNEKSDKWLLLALLYILL